ncbi:SDR family oxidoreductase [Roseomonas sp. HJA6]|uniref:SDR family oxidoreductase n=1 Tax=Roseomonas alba TaxID=2846776 RepID=A0ABS7AEU1_9PROT|nr:SDR family oxidoreductase [Neoroseomonas alba]MBW6399800.1 SDR family oxidoreductase [Neoroseomonas alba]
MHVFVTGATGFVGSAVVRDLIAAGHRVRGLARSEAAAATLAEAGADPHRGSLEDPDSLVRGTEGVDAVVHTAFNHDFTRFAENCALDGRVIAALGGALLGSRRPLIVTSGIGLLPPGRFGQETDAPATGANPRVATEAAAAELAARGVRVGVVRLPPSVHGTGDHGFVPILIGIARAKGVSVFAGEGANRWPAVHRGDAARLYRLVLETGVTQARYHAVAEEGVPFRDIAAAIARGLGVPCVSRPAEDAAAHFGWFAHFAELDVPASSAATRAALGWTPEGPGLIADLDGPGYVAA